MLGTPTTALIDNYQRLLPASYQNVVDFQRVVELKASPAKQDITMLVQVRVCSASSVCGKGVTRCDSQRCGCGAPRVQARTACDREAVGTH